MSPARKLARAIDLLAQPQPDIERHLLIAAAAGVDLVGQAAHALFELADDHGVDIFVGCPGEELRLASLVADRVESGYELRPFRRRQDADAFERPRERLRAADVRVDQPPVEVERTGKPLEDFRGTFLEPAAPELHTDFFLDFLLAFITAARTWIGSPIRLMNPRASFWSYSAPMVKLAISSEYSE